MDPSQLSENVARLLNLLDQVEQGIRISTASLNSQESIQLAKRLREVADLVDKKCNALEISDDDDFDEEDDLLEEPTLEYPQVKRETSAQLQKSEGSAASGGSTEPGVNVKREGVAPSPPLMSSVQHQPPLHHASSAPLPSTVQPQQPPQQQTIQQGGPSNMYKRFSNTRPPELDAMAKKRRLEAEAMIKKLDRPQTYSCGISYNGDAKEKEFSDGIKEDLKHHLPALKTHRHLFRYMAWATTERLQCDHCRKCTNMYGSGV